MSLMINTNSASLQAQLSLNTSQADLKTSLMRLSSGLRINSAMDDAAGMAIASRMTSQMTGLSQAIRNANDGISLAQTASGALTNTTTMLQRIRDLAVQSANASNVSTDRSSLNAETQQLLAEIQRTSTTTQFNGQNILDGTFGASQFQIGANASQTITTSILNSQLSNLGSYQVTSGVTAVTGTALTGGDLLVNNTDVGASNSGSAEDIASAINAVSNQTGVTASGSTTTTSAAGSPLLRNQTLQSGDLLINGVNIGAVSGSSNIATQGRNIANAINAVSNQTGVTASANTSTGALTLTSNTGKTIALTTNTTLNNTATLQNEAATRVMNASGLTMGGAQRTYGGATLVFDNGGKQIVTLTFSSNPTGNAAAVVGDTITIAGKTFTFIASGGTTDATHIAVDGTDTALNAANIVKAISTAFAGVLVTAAAGAGGVVTIQSLINYKSSAATDGLLAITQTGGGVANTVLADATGATSGIVAGDTIKVGGVTYEFTLPTAAAAAGTGNVQVKIGATDTATATAFATALNTSSTSNNGTAALTSNTTGTVVINNLLYGDATVEPIPAIGAASSGADATTIAITTTTGTNATYAANNTYGTLSLNSGNTFSISGNNTAKAGLSAAQSNLSSISTVDISTVSGANNAIALIDGALAQVSAGQGALGALQNRFTNVVTNLNSTSTNLAAARSRIQDTDYAAETTIMTRNQILQQAGMAMLAQANALPNGVMALLR